MLLGERGWGDSCEWATAVEERLQSVSEEHMVLELFECVVVNGCKQ